MQSDLLYRVGGQATSHQSAALAAGVPPGRIAYFTGQRPARKRRPASRPGAPSSQAQPGGGVGAENKSGATRTAADPAGSSKAVAETQALGQNGTSPAIASAPAAGAASRTPGSSSRGRKRSIAVSDDDLVLALQRYLGGSKAGHSRQEAPWAELGMSGGAPIFQGGYLVRCEVRQTRLSVNTMMFVLDVGRGQFGAQNASQNCLAVLGQKILGDGVLGMEVS